MLDVDRRDDGFARAVRVAVLGLDAGAAPALDDQPHDALPAQHGAAVLPDAVDQRLGEPARASARDRPAPPLAAEDDRIRERAGAGGVDRHERLVRLPEHERLHVAAFELVPDHVPGAHHPPPLPDVAAGVLAQPLLDTRAEAGRVERPRREDVLDLVVLGEHAPIGLAVGLRVARDLLDRAVEVHPRGELLPVRERDVGERVGHEVLEPVALLQTELVVQEQRVGLDQRVSGRARVDQVARPEQLLGRGAAAGDGARVEHEHLAARHGQIRRGDEAVVAGARDDDVGHPSSASTLAPSACGSRPAKRTVATGSGSAMSNGWSVPRTR